MKVAIYARFSSQLQKDSSIEDQVRDCRARAEREGWQVDRVFSDYAVSGAVRDRPGLNALLDHVRAGQAQIVLAEAIDRLSRDQEDLAALHKRVRHAGARIVTLSEGDIDELQIGFKGTMASLFRRDLADKIRRGQRGRVAGGRVPGGLVYGYRKVARLDSRGEPERGLREIDPDQAKVVRRIVREYLAGESPLAIARRLNAEGVPSPSGRTWNVSAINGDSVRGSGILCNPIYAGALVYNRTTMVRDPDTRRRVPRVNPPELWQREAVPHLAIVSAEDWQAVRARKAEFHDWSFTSQRRPRRLLSGLVECGQCGGQMVVIGAGKLGCGNARRTGTCRNRRTMRADVLERRVLAGLKGGLLTPERQQRALSAYRQERARLDRESRVAGQQARRRIGELEKQVERLLAVVAAGAGDVPELAERLKAAAAERDRLTTTIGEDEAARVITLHPHFGQAWKGAVDKIDALLGGDTLECAEARTAIRSLIARVILTPAAEARGMTVEIESRLSTVTALATGQQPTRGTVPVVAEERFGFDRTLFRISA